MGVPSVPKWPCVSSDAPMRYSACLVSLSDLYQWALHHNTVCAESVCAAMVEDRSCKGTYSPKCIVLNLCLIPVTLLLQLLKTVSLAITVCVCLQQTVIDGQIFDLSKCLMTIQSEIVYKTLLSHRRGLNNAQPPMCKNSKDIWQDSKDSVCNRNRAACHD